MWTRPGPPVPARRPTGERARGGPPDRGVPGSRVLLPGVDGSDGWLRTAHAPGRAPTGPSATRSWTVSRSGWCSPPSPSPACCCCWRSPGTTCGRRPSSASRCSTSPRRPWGGRGSAHAAVWSWAWSRGWRSSCRCCRWSGTYRRVRCPGCSWHCCRRSSSRRSAQRWPCSAAAGSARCGSPPPGWPPEALRGRGTVRGLPVGPARVHARPTGRRRGWRPAAAPRWSAAAVALTGGAARRGRRPSLVAHRPARGEPAPPGQPRVGLALAAGSPPPPSRASPAPCRPCTGGPTRGDGRRSCRATSRGWALDFDAAARGGARATTSRPPPSSPRAWRRATCAAPDLVDLAGELHRHRPVPPTRRRPSLIDRAAAATSACRCSSGRARRARSRCRSATPASSWDPGTGPGDRYVKRHPVPFGEYIPLRSARPAGLQRGRPGRARHGRRGRAPGSSTSAAVPLGDVICFEVAYDGLVRDVVTGARGWCSSCRRTTPRSAARPRPSSSWRCPGCAPSSTAAAVAGRRDERDQRGRRARRRRASRAGIFTRGVLVAEPCPRWRPATHARRPGAGALAGAGR